MSTARRACLLLLCLLPPLACAKSEEKAAEDTLGFRYIELAPAFVVNFGAAGRIGYLKADISLRVASAGVAGVEHHMPAIRHALVMLLSRQDAERLAAVGQREPLRREALETVRGAIAEASGAAPAAAPAGGKPPEPAVQDLLFTSFILQR